MNTIDNWSTPANNFKYEMDFESDDDLDQARSSPFTCCWSSPEFVADSEQRTPEELSASEEAYFVDGNARNGKSERDDLSGYDEPMRTSILDFDGQSSEQLNILANLNSQTNAKCPRAISENDSLCIYDASPSPIREDEKISFVDELPETEEAINKWTPEALINFAKEGFCKISKTENQHSLADDDVMQRSVNISKSLGSLNLWETEIGWITRVPSPVNAAGAMHQSISCHDHMITSFVDCAIQNHYNRCSSPGCRKYASKPKEAMKRGNDMNSGSDTSDDEWIRCADDMTLSDAHENNDEIYAQVILSPFPTSNDSDSDKLLITIDHQHSGNLHMDNGSKEIADGNKDKMMKCKSTKASSTALKTPIGDADVIRMRNGVVKRGDDKCLSYQERTQYSILLDALPRRPYSLNSLEQMSCDFDFFNAKRLANNTDSEQHHADSRDLSNFNLDKMCYPNTEGKSDVKYESGKSVENDDNVDDDDDDDDDGIFVEEILPVEGNKLPNFYEFTFGVKNSIGNNTTKLSPCVAAGEGLYSFADERCKTGDDSETADEPHSTVALWDNCCEYAQQINEIARIWFRKAPEPSNINGVITDQTAFAIYPKSGDRTKFTVEGVELDSWRFPVSSSFNSSQPSTNGFLRFKIDFE
ncbi:unnamed protein product [Litomosoides sigmodontis]|uniref:Uncharacterized protein n=1 Tax=Litomosoides sigmodontis TaxID=42156 RepID=A0A3P7JNG4_LITSI|nr:unnamed protein product [Litomosoides sigmodontis]